MDYGNEDMSEYAFTQPGRPYSTDVSPAYVDGVQCPHCGQACELKYQKATNKPYWSCNSVSYNGTCTNPKGYFIWAEDVGKPKPPPQKRYPAAPPQHQPPAQRQMPQPLPAYQPAPPMPAPPAPQTTQTASRVAEAMIRIEKKLDFISTFITQHLQTKPAEEEEIGSTSQN